MGLPGERAKATTPTGGCYSDELADKICSLLIGGMSLGKICKMQGMPDISTVLKWVRQNEDFYKKYYEARALQAEGLIDEIIEIADDGSRDYTTKVLENGKEVTVVDHDHISRSRLRIDTRRFLATKLIPRIYGDKVQVDPGASGSAVLVILGREEDKIDSES